MMYEYILERGVDGADIIIDDKAVVTADSCRAEHVPELADANVVLVTQNFHLHRAILQCRKLGIHAYGYPAEYSDSIDRSQTPFLTKISVRSHRFIRESVLVWAVIVGLYK